VDLYAGLCHIVYATVFTWSQFLTSSRPRDKYTYSTLITRTFNFILFKSRLNLARESGGAPQTPGPHFWVDGGGVRTVMDTRMTSPSSTTAGPDIVRTGFSGTVSYRRQEGLDGGGTEAWNRATGKPEPLRRRRWRRRRRCCGAVRGGNVWTSWVDHETAAVEPRTQVTTEHRQQPGRRTAVALRRSSATQGSTYLRFEIFVISTWWKSGLDDRVAAD